MALVVEGDRPSVASIMRLAKTQSPATPGVLPARTTALPNHKTESARQSSRSPISETTAKFHKLSLRPTITTTPKSPPSVDVLRQADEMFSRVILSLPKRLAEVSNSGTCTYSYNTDRNTCPSRFIQETYQASYIPRLP